MNYIELIRGFWRSHEEHSFSTTEIALYFHLLEVCNICSWKNPFKRNNSKIGADLGISFNTLKNSRNRLAQCGLLTFKTANGSPNVIYTLSKFDKVTNEVSTEVNDEVSTEVANEVLPTKDKLNKTVKTSSIVDRKLKFSQSLSPFLETYGKDVLNEFYRYWTEPNKSNTKFRQELEKTWDLKRRLDTWTKNDFNKSKSKPFSKLAVDESENKNIFA